MAAFEEILIAGLFVAVIIYLGSDIPAVALAAAAVTYSGLQVVRWLMIRRLRRRLR